ncbi:MAG: hypothetical protein H5T97_09995 [Firmicutes bacterium]|nr:hypothetical protein [Bacillota bacterium]
MLDKIVSFIFMVFFLFAFAFVAVLGVAMFVQWGAVQNQAQFVAASMGRWGGYTQEAENAVRDFAARLNLPRSAVRVEVSDVGPAPFGTPVWAKIRVPYRFEIGPFKIGTYDLAGMGRSVSSYLPGAYQVGYVSP